MIFSRASFVNIFSGKTDTRSRDIYLDISKGICIFLVVIFHATRSLVNSGAYSSGFSLDFFDNLAYSFHVQVFFILSGFFLVKGRQSYDSDFIKLVNLLYQYVLWSVIYIILSNLFSGQVNNRIPFSSALSILWHPVLHLWFLLVLAICIIVNMIIRFLRKDLYLLLIIFSSILSLTAVGWIQYLLYFLPFFFIGVILKKRNVSFRYNKMLYCVFTLALLIISLSGVFLSTKYNYQIRSFPFYIVSFSSCFLVVFVPRVMSINIVSKCISYVGQRSLCIYLSHVLFVSLSKSVFSYLSIKNFYLIIIGCSVFGIAGPLICLWFSRAFRIAKWLGFDPLLSSRRDSGGRHTSGLIGTDEPA